MTKLLCIDGIDTSCLSISDHFLPQVHELSVYYLKRAEMVDIGGELVEMYELEDYEGYLYDPSRFIPLTENIEA